MDIITFGQGDQSDHPLKTQSPGQAIVHKFTPSGRTVQSQYSSDISIPVFTWIHLLQSNKKKVDYNENHIYSCWIKMTRCNAFLFNNIMDTLCINLLIIYRTNLNISPSPQPLSLSLSGNLHWLQGSVVHWKLLQGVLQTFVWTVSPHGLPPFDAFRSTYSTMYPVIDEKNLN